MNNRFKIIFGLALFVVFGLSFVYAEDYPQCEVSNQNPNTLEKSYFNCNEGEWYGASLKIESLSPNYAVMHTEGQFNPMTTKELKVGKSFQVQEVVPKTKWTVKVEDIAKDKDGNTAVYLSIVQKRGFFQRFFSKNK